ncbi:hypothetical protein SDC9_210501 [bioreactor metagenome]|uniref:Uncharacterized protein n=1 Tax=bioreactor metagenome TaxID=1076179 RepID=A0A645JGB7_9ZZZZ
MNGTAFEPDAQHFFIKLPAAANRADCLNILKEKHIADNTAQPFAVFTPAAPAVKGEVLCGQSPPLGRLQVSKNFSDFVISAGIGGHIRAFHPGDGGLLNLDNCIKFFKARDLSGTSGPLFSQDIKHQRRLSRT